MPTIRLNYGYKPIVYCQEFDFMHNKLIHRSLLMSSYGYLIRITIFIILFLVVSFCNNEGGIEKRNEKNSYSIKNTKSNEIENINKKMFLLNKKGSILISIFDTKEKIEYNSKKYNFNVIYCKDFDVDTAYSYLTENYIEYLGDTILLFNYYKTVNRIVFFDKRFNINGYKVGDKIKIPYRENDSSFFMDPETENIHYILMKSDTTIIKDKYTVLVTFNLGLLDSVENKSFNKNFLGHTIISIEYFVLLNPIKYH